MIRHHSDFSMPPTSKKASSVNMQHGERTPQHHHTKSHLSITRNLSSSLHRNQKMFQQYQRVVNTAINYNSTRTCQEAADLRRIRNRRKMLHSMRNINNMVSHQCEIPTLRELREEELLQALNKKSDAAML